jgi:peptidoglycan/xylan/chitin deacetylase (PgdA/CDA1 family)
MYAYNSEHWVPTLYVASNLIGANSFMNTSQIGSLYSIGAEVADNTWDHANITTATTNSTLNLEMVQSKSSLSSLGYGVCGFAAPGFYTGANVLNKSQTNYYYTVQSGTVQNTQASLLASLDKNNILAVSTIGVGIGQTIPDLASAKTAIDSSASSNTWLVLRFGAIDNQNVSGHTSPNVFNQIIQYANSKYQQNKMQYTTQVQGFGYNCNASTTINAPQIPARLTFPTYNGSVGMISFAFDHDFNTQYSPMLMIYSYNGQHFVPSLYTLSNRIDNQGFISNNQLSYMYNLGSEVQSHSWDHLQLSSSNPVFFTNGVFNQTLYNKTLNLEIVQSKQNLTSKGYKVCGFVPPYNYLDANMMKLIVQNYNYSIFQPTNKENSLASIQSYKTKYGIDGGQAIDVGVGRKVTNLSGAITYINSAEQNHTWLMFHWHEINNVNTSYNTAPKLFEQIIQYVNSQIVQGKLAYTTYGDGMGFAQNC